MAPAGAAAQFPGTDLLRLADEPSRNPSSRRTSASGAWPRSRPTRADHNVYVVRRADGYGDNGTPWRAGGRVLASRGLGGQPANGPSTLPSLDGTSRVAPHCVAFVSAASNLVRGDTNGKPDAFLHDLRTGSLRRVSVNSRGRQSNGTVSEVAVNGLCTRVAFVSDAADLALRRTKNRSWRTAVTRANPPGRRQVYVRAIGGTNGIDRALKGLTFLASATDRGRPGDGDSHSIAFTHNSDTRALTFASDARNLSSRDGNGVTDVYQRVMTRGYGRKFRGRRPPQLRMNTSLVSAGADGRAGVGPLDLAGEQRRRLDGRVRDDRRRPHRPRDQRAPDRHGAGGRQPVAGHAARVAQPRRRARQRAERRTQPDRRRHVGGLRLRGDRRRPDHDARAGHQRRARRDAGHGALERSLAARRGGARGPTTNPVTSPHGNYVVFERGGHAWLLYVGEK